MKIAIITRPENRSPKNLAESLKNQLNKISISSFIYEDIQIVSNLNRLYIKKENKFISIYNCIKYYIPTKIFLRKLKKYDILIISECIPNAFIKNLYNIELLRKIINKPILLYEVYYLGNAPTQIHNLNLTGNPTFSRYDWHLSVTNLTEIKSRNLQNWSCIGIDLTYTGLSPIFRSDLYVLVDFPQRGFEKYRQNQIEILRKNNIKTIILEGEYSFKEIRKLYQNAAAFLMQSYEAFGVSIAECLSCGTQIFTPDSSWPMSWRLDENPQIHSKGQLADCFTVYDNPEDFEIKIKKYLKNYNPYETPKKVFQEFVKYYPNHFYGNVSELEKVINMFKV